MNIKLQATIHDTFHCLLWWELLKNTSVIFNISTFNYSIHFTKLCKKEKIVDNFSSKDV